MNPNPGFSGSGPGPIAQDGCAVELYRRLPYLGELEDLRPYLPAGSSLLELGCGAGRLTRVLLGLGLDVTAVDNSVEMLACLPPDVQAVLSDIESLSLPARFDHVLLASSLIHHPCASVRRRMIGSCRAHLKPGGQLIFGYFEAEWLARVREGTLGREDGVEIRIAGITRSARTARMTVEYRLDGQTWTHTFTSEILHRVTLERVLTPYGFSPVHWMDGPHRWARTVAMEHGRG